MRILVAEDERDLNMLISRKLRSQGFSVDSCHDGLEALDMLSAAEYDGLVLDIMMPGADGYAVLRFLRDRGDMTPVLFLTARDSVADRVRGLDSGANDYLVKPFSLEELLARIRSMTRPRFGMVDNVLRAADLEVDTAARRVTRAGREIRLTPREYKLLEYLIRNRGIVLSRDRIESHIWDFAYEGGTNVVDVYIRYLRKKLDTGHEKKLIHTVRGAGYVLREEGPSC